MRVSKSVAASRWGHATKLADPYVDSARVIQIISSWLNHMELGNDGDAESSFASVGNLAIFSDFPQTLWGTRRVGLAELLCCHRSRQYSSSFLRCSPIPLKRLRQACQRSPASPSWPVPNHSDQVRRCLSLNHPLARSEPRLSVVRFQPKAAWIKIELAPASVTTDRRTWCLTPVHRGRHVHERIELDWLQFGTPKIQSGDQKPPQSQAWAEVESQGAQHTWRH